MAGAVSISTTITHNSDLENPMQNPPPLFATIAQWEVKYARFVCFRSIDYQSTHPCLVPLTGVKNSRRGNWISTASPSAIIKLVYEKSSTGSDDALLFITTPQWVLEEHRISKMRFSWPQVSCLSGYPARGSKAVFVSYKDHEGQIQKFALHFVTMSDAEKFMNILKEILGDGSEKFLQIQCSEFNSGLSSQAEVVPLHEPTYRHNGDLQLPTSENNSMQPINPSIKPDASSEEFQSHDVQQMPHDPEGVWQLTISENNSMQPIIPSIKLDASQESQSHDVQQMPHDPEAAVSMPAFPPSFTDLLNSCSAAVAVKPKDCQESLKTQFLQYLEGVSVEEMLATVENAINELGDDLLLF